MEDAQFIDLLKGINVNLDNITGSNIDENNAQVDILMEPVKSGMPEKFGAIIGMFMGAEDDTQQDAFFDTISENEQNIFKELGLIILKITTLNVPKKDNLFEMKIVAFVKRRYSL